MNKNFLIAVFAVVFFTSFLPQFAQAQDPKAEPSPAAAPAAETEDLAFDETEFSFGTVKGVKDNEIVVTEYDYESNADVDVTYQVPADTEFENVASLKEIAVGDSIDIDFLVEGANKKAVAITVEKPLPEEEEALVETGEPAEEVKEAKE